MVRLRLDNVIDFESPQSKALIAALREGQVEERLVKYGAALTGSPAEGEDLFRDAVCLMCDADKGMTWDPSRHSALRHARFVMHHLARKGWRSARKRREVLDDEVESDETIPEPDPPPDESVEQARELARNRRLGELLRQRLHDKSAMVYERRCEGIEDSADLARLCQLTIQEVYVANRAIAHQAGIVMYEEELAEARRMKDLRFRQASSKPPARPRTGTPSAQSHERSSLTDAPSQASSHERSILTARQDKR